MVRLSTVLGFALATASVLIPGVLSQDEPACGQTCAQQAASTSGCNVSDNNCICNSAAFGDEFGTCLGESCSPADAQATLDIYISNCDDLAIPDDTSFVLPTNTPNTDTATGPRTATSPTGTSPASVVSSPTSTSPTSKSNHATHNQPVGVLGAGFAMALALFA